MRDFSRYSPQCIHTFSFSFCIFFNAPFEGPFSPSASPSLGGSVSGMTFSAGGALFSAMTCCVQNSVYVHLSCMNFLEGHWKWDASLMTHAPKAGHRPGNFFITTLKHRHYNSTLFLMSIKRNESFTCSTILLKPYSSRISLTVKHGMQHLNSLFISNYLFVAIKYIVVVSIRSTFHSFHPKQ